MSRTRAAYTQTRRVEVVATYPAPFDPRPLCNFLPARRSRPVNRPLPLTRGMLWHTLALGFARAVQSLATKHPTPNTKHRRTGRVLGK
jgi:hypothetical protein